MAANFLFPVVGIGASAGGLEALTRFFRTLPADTGMSFVVVVHLDPNHNTVLGELIGKITPLPIEQVQDGVAIRANTVYVIPPNKRMILKGGVLLLQPREGNPPMPIDAFFHSLADSRKSLSIGIVLSGNGSDGVLGLGSIKEAEGITFCQDLDSAKFDGMPRSAMESGFVDRVLPPEEIALAVAGRVEESFTAAGPPSIEPDDLTEIFATLHRGVGLDLKRYRHTTVRRRILRRLAVLRLDNLERISALS